jgi:hypothetical protein
MLRLSTVRHVNGARPQCDFAAIRKTAAIEDGRVEKDMRSTRSGMDAVNCPEVFRGTWDGLVAILV